MMCNECWTLAGMLSQENGLPQVENYNQLLDSGAYHETVQHEEVQKEKENCSCHCHDEKLQDIHGAMNDHGLLCRCIKNCIHCNPNIILPTEPKE
jgi:hypothetical protein